jgi:hypothetical protein
VHRLPNSVRRSRPPSRTPAELSAL